MGAKQSRPLPPPPTRPDVPGIPAEFQELHALCEPAQDPEQAAHLALPFRLPKAATLEDAMTVVGGLLLNNNQDWIRDLEKIQKVLDNSTTFSLDWFKHNKERPHSAPYVATPRYFYLVSMAAIFFDQECSSNRTLEAASFVKPLPPQIPVRGFWKPRPPHRYVGYGILPLFEHMLLVDYGFGSQPLEFRKWDRYKHEMRLSARLDNRVIRRILVPEIYTFCQGLVELVNHWRTEAFPRDHPEMICAQ
ncbi:hypothetical protein N0V82_010849 [Gnomoniopsis sp. IMI 355080]|nr:hypothetical protein N0V82_010849 [Gnomoniopsis sp. IMI 355080]